MSTDDLQRIRDIFLRAREVPAAERAVFLDKACEGDPLLRAEVESLLAADVAQTADDPRPALGMPGKIGPYTILGVLGEGGMGMVYKGRQTEPINRLAAIKVVKPGFNTRSVIARFQSERRALAMMDHPNIAKVYDAGMTDLGQPYFAMEFVAGLPITRFCDRYKLPIRQRLRLFLRVCEAIEHAHQKLIIHRDIKPTNVMAYVQDGRPAVKVIDFGIAKALSDDIPGTPTQYTLAGSVVGTYEYMSPEQAAGARDIDARTDVYSLGVLLYELLAGTRPFDPQVLSKASDQEIRRMIQEEEPPKPSTRLSALGKQATSVVEARQTEVHSLVRQLRSELEWIPLMAMRKEPARRYATPLQLAEDIRNYLEKRPLLAGPESNVYRLRKFVSKRRAPLLAAAAVVLALAVGVIGANMGLFGRRDLRLAADAPPAKSDQQHTSAQSVADGEHPRGGPLGAPQGQPVLAMKSDEEPRQLDSANAAESKLPARISASDGWTNSIGMKFALIPAGEFLMGTPEGDRAGRRLGVHPGHEIPHLVELTKPFMMGVFLVTQGQWKAVMGNNPSSFRGDDLPVERVSWDDAVAFCNALSQKEGKHYRLPTEAQWEYACRAGTTTEFYTGDEERDLDEAGWYFGNSEQKTHPVGQKKPNAWGLYDMHGNVLEWCGDWFVQQYPEGEATDPTGPGDGKNRVLRGGSWDMPAGACRSAFRGENGPDVRENGAGFRVALDVDAAPGQRETAAAVEEPLAPAPGLAEGIQPRQNIGDTWSNSIGMKFATVAAGEFVMGSPPGETDRDDQETQHRVKLTKPFMMGIFLVTQGQWKAVMGNNPSGHPQGDDLPVEKMSWNDAVAFCDTLSQREGKHYHLPTEAQWEYACRAGTTTSYSTGDGEAVLMETDWYDGNSDRTTHPVGQKKPNAWGLYDMHGNVWEWCADWYGPYPAGEATDPTGPGEGEDRVIRGGAYIGRPSECRSACRGHHAPDITDMATNSIGFRVCLDGIEIPPQRDLGAAREAAAAVEAQRQTRIAELLAVAKANDSKEKGWTALAALDELLKLEPGHAEAAALRRKIGAYYDTSKIGDTWTNGIGMKFAFIRAGEFPMGTSDEDGENRLGIHPGSETQHRVKLSKPFMMGVFVVTQRQWKTVMGNNPSYFQGDDLPVEQVPWNDAAAFCNTLSRREGRHYRLPTEAQWEYACRAGTTTAYYTGDELRDLDGAGWCFPNSENKTHAVGQKKPNAWGLYDMHGNVLEWCGDWFAPLYSKGHATDPTGPGDGEERVLRGGAWDMHPEACRSAFRGSERPETRSNMIGFRVCLDFP